MGSAKVIVAIFDGYGGPEKAEMGTDGYEAGPTDAGAFVIAYCGKHSSSRYPDWSKIQWGSRLKEEGGTVWVEHDGKWRKLEELTRVTKAAILDYHELLYGTRDLPSTWVFNDFGHQTCYYFKDKNKNRKLDQGSGERIHGEFFHTTPLNEAQTKLAQKDPTIKVGLEESHGCIHVKPADMDLLVRKGYFKKGNTLVVHTYSAKPAPGSVKRGIAPYEVHFYPGAHKIYVLGAQAPR